MDSYAIIVNHAFYFEKCFPDTFNFNGMAGSSLQLTNFIKHGFNLPDEWKCQICIHRHKFTTRRDRIS